MRALLNHKDPTVAAQGRQMVKASADPAVRALLNKSAAGVASAIHGSPRADRGAKTTSKAGISVPAVEGKVVRPAPTSNIGARFVHFAGMTPLAPIADEPVLTDIQSGDAAAFVIASAAKARGQRPAAAAKSPAAAKHDMSTPEGVAAFVAASAAKCRAPSR